MGLFKRKPKVRKSHGRIGLITVEGTHHSLFNGGGNSVTVQFRVEELGLYGDYSRVKILGVTGVEPHLHRLAKAGLPEYVETEDIEWILDAKVEAG